MATLENLDSMERGETAAFVKSRLDPIILDGINAVLAELISMYRGRDMSHDFLVGKIGELSALYYLQDSLDSQIRRGSVARGKELANAS